jgi:K+-sensing histidine kinase KdpD
LEFFDANNYKFKGSENKIFEAVSVAIDNAIFWHSGNEKIIIKSEKNKNKKFINLLILDRGPGISKSDKKNIFKQNFSMSGSTGIGLYRARLLLRELGGDINVEERAGGGTCVIFKLKLHN